MTKELLNKADHLNHDIDVLESIKYEQERNHWVGFRIPTDTPLDALWTSELIDDFEKWIDAEIKKAQKMFEEL